MVDSRVCPVWWRRATAGWSLAWLLVALLFVLALVMGVVWSAPWWKGVIGAAGLAVCVGCLLQSIVEDMRVRGGKS